MDFPRMDEFSSLIGRDMDAYRWLLDLDELQATEAPGTTVNHRGREE
jgi:hypothetical protein